MLPKCYKVIKIVLFQRTMIYSEKMSVLTLSSRVSFTALPLCDQVNIGSGKPETSHSNFIFCPALAITLERGTINAGDSVGSNAVKGVNF